MAVVRRTCGDAVVLGVSGVLDHVTAPSLNSYFTLVLTDAPAVLVVDLTDVDFMSSAGITLLIETQR